MNTAVSFIIGFIGIGIMVLVHETGHFFAAKIMNIEVEVFAIGWGKALKRWKRGKTEYRINLFPLGGYCRLKGSKDLERAIASKDDSYGALEDGSLFKAHPLKRIFTYVGGPLANVLLAIVLFVPYFMIGYTTQVDPAKIIVTSDYPRLLSIQGLIPTDASRAGLQTGDTIQSVDGIAITDFQQLQQVLASRPLDKSALFRVERSGVVETISIMPAYDSKARKPVFGVASYIEPVVAYVELLSPESAAGLSVGDRIVEVQNKLVSNTFDIAETLVDNPSEIHMVVERQGKLVSIHFTPGHDTQGNALLQFGLARKTVWREGSNIFSALGFSVRETFGMIGETYAAIPRILFGLLDVGQVLAGPLRISYVIGDMAHTGIRSGLANGLRTICWILSIVSVSLAAANLLPIPALDGGMILLGIYEMAAGRLVKPRMYARLQMIGALFIILLFIIASIGDIRFFL